MVLIEGKNVGSTQIQLSFFISLWFLVGEKDKDRKQRGVSRVCPRPSHLTEGGPGVFAPSHIAPALLCDLGQGPKCDKLTWA